MMNTEIKKQTKENKFSENNTKCKEYTNSKYNYSELKSQVFEQLKVKKTTNEYYLCKCPFENHSNDDDNPQFVFYKTIGNAYCSKCNKSYNLFELAERLGIDVNDFRNTEVKEIPQSFKQIQQHYKDVRKISYIPECLFENKKIYLQSYKKNGEGYKFQQWIYDKEAEKDKRLNLKGKIENFLFIPTKWEDYKPQDETHKQNIYLCEGIPDCLSLLNAGFKAIAFRSKLINDKGIEELKDFVKDVKPQLNKLIVIPDKDAFMKWKKRLTKLAKELDTKIEIVDLTVLKTNLKKFDINDLWKNLNNPLEFRSQITWLRKQMYFKYGNIIKDYHKRAYYMLKTSTDKEGNETTKKIRLSNFIMTMRNLLYKKEVGEGKRKITFYFDGDKETKTLETRITGDYNKFKEELNKINDILYLEGGSRVHKQILALENKIKQTTLKINAYEEYGSITDELTLFKNVAFKDNKPYEADEKGNIRIENELISCLPIDAPTLNTREENNSNSKFIETLFNLFGNVGIFTLAHTLASVRMKTIIEKEKKFPLLRLYGERGSGKSTLNSSICQLFGLNDDVILGEATKTGMYRVATKYNYLPIVLDDSDSFTDVRFQIDAYNRVTKLRAKMTNDNQTFSNKLTAIVMENSNNIPDISNRTYRRKVYFNLKKSDLHSNKESDTLMFELTELAKENNIAYLNYCLKIDIQSVYNKSKKELKQALIDYKNINFDTIFNYTPTLTGLNILFELQLITEKQYEEYKKLLIETIKNELDKNSTENETTSFIEYLHELSNEFKKSETTESGEKEYFTEINPNIDYTVKTDRETKNELLVIKPELIQKVNKNRQKKFDKKVMEIESNEFFIEKKVSRIGNGWNKTAWIFDYEKIKTELGLGFRKVLTIKPYNNYKIAKSDY